MHPLLLLAAMSLAADPPKKPTPKFTLGKDTTAIAEPLTADGYLDYEAALNDRLRGKIKPDTNAVVGLLAATGPKPGGGELPADFFKSLGIDTPAADGDYLVSHVKHFADDLREADPQAFYAVEAELKVKPWTADDAPKHADWLKVNGKPLAAVAKAARQPDYYHPLVPRSKDGSPGLLLGAPLPLAQTCREMAELLAFRAMLRCGEGKHEDAWADILTIHRLGRLVASGGTTIEFLVGIALGAIAHQSEQAFIAAAKPEAKTALKCQADLLALPPWPKYADKLDLTERFVTLDTLQSLRRDGPIHFVPRKPGEPKPTRDEIDANMGKLDWDAMFRLNTKWLDALVTAAAKPTRAARTAAFAEVDAGLKKVMAEVPQLGDIIDLLEKAGDEKGRAAASDQLAVAFVRLMAPAAEKLSTSGDRAEQLSRHGVLAFALAAYHADQKKYPAALADLTPKYLKVIPDDLFSGKPLVYETTQGGYRLYSFGENGKDDGGRTRKDQPPGDDLALTGPGR